MQEQAEIKPRKKKCGCSWPNFTALWEAVTCFTDGQWWIPFIKTFARDPTPPSTTALLLATGAGALPGISGALGVHWDFNEQQNEDGESGHLPLVVHQHPRRYPKYPEIVGRYALFAGDAFAHFQTFISSSVILIFTSWGMQLPIYSLVLITVVLMAFSGLSTVGEIRPCLSAVRARLYGIPEENNEGEKPDVFTWSATLFGAYRSGVNGYALAKVLDVLFSLFFTVVVGPLGVSNYSAGIGFFLGFTALVSQLIMHTIVNLDFQDPTHHHDGVNWMMIFDRLNRLGKVLALIMMAADYFPGHTNDYGQAVISIDSSFGQLLPLPAKAVIYPGVIVGSALCAKSESVVCRNKLVKKLTKIGFFAQKIEQALTLRHKHFLLTQEIISPDQRVLALPSVRK